MRSRVGASSAPLASALFSPRYPSSAAGLLLTRRNKFGTPPSCFLTAESKGWGAAGEASIEAGVGRRDTALFLSYVLERARARYGSNMIHASFGNNNMD